MSIRFKQILFPTDFSETSNAALKDAKDIAKLMGAQLHCIHVVDDAGAYWSAFGPEGMPIGPPPDEILALGKSRMEKFAKEQLADVSPRAMVHVVVGRPFVEIIAYAREKNIDLIVMSTHGRGAIAQMLLGSTTEKVVRKAPCAVLTIRAHQHEFVAP